MKIFVAGGSGAIGVPLVRALDAAGHEVTALTRSPGKEDALRALGAEPAIADALDRDALAAVVARARPDAVIHQLTALPKGGPSKASDLAPTNRLRVEGTRNLLDAAIHAGVKRFLVGSFAPGAPRPDGTGALEGASAAVASMETQVIDATRRGAIEGVILRYGLFYGPEAPSTLWMIDRIRKRHLPVIRGDSGQLPVISIEDAVGATVLALERAPAGAVYDIVDDRAVSLAEMVQALAEYTGSAPPRRVPAWLPKLIAPYMARVTAIRMPLSNAKAKADLGWRLRYPTMREGLARMFRQAA